MVTLDKAIEMVRTGQARRVAAPGQWKVWREGSNVLHEMLSDSPEYPVFAAYVKNQTT